MNSSTLSTTAQNSETLTAETKEVLKTLDALYTEQTSSDGVPFVTICIPSADLNKFILERAIDTTK